MPELKLHIPTYNHGEFRKNTDQDKKSEFGEPYVPVVIRPDSGVRIVLGSLDYFAADTPDIRIERRPNGWAIFLHPLGGSDPSGYIYFLDDGRSFLVPKGVHGATPPIRLLQWNEAVLQVDNPNQSQADNLQICMLCDGPLACSGDNWDGLCPECADKVSEHLDENNLNDEDRDDVIQILRRSHPKN